MKFQVPQFVEVEDKIFWHLTLKQFIYVAGGAGMCVLIYVTVPYKFLAILLAMPIAAFALALAFYTYNNRPFIVVVEAASKYLFNSRLYIWRKVEPTFDPKKLAEQVETPGSAFVPKLSDSKLKELTWSLDTKESVNPITHGDKTT
jgi:hypothetical protein